LHEGVDDKHGHSAAAFWTAIEGGDGTLALAEMDRPAAMRAARLFLCRASCVGGFEIKEKRPERCQDDLDDHQCAILVVEQTQVFVWVGSCASAVVQKMTAAAAKETAARIARSQQSGHVQLITVFEGSEPVGFTNAFHGWSRHIRRTLDLGREIEYVDDLLAPLPALPPLHQRHPNSPFQLHYA
jgi:hypothetical protein